MVWQAGVQPTRAINRFRNEYSLLSIQNVMTRSTAFSHTDQAPSKRIFVFLESEYSGSEHRCRQSTLSIALSCDMPKSSSALRRALRT